MKKIMVKRKAFHDVDPNRPRRTRRACASKGSNRSITSNSSLASLADDSEFDFLTNPKGDEPMQAKAVGGVSKNEKESVWNSSTKTPKISNCTMNLQSAKRDQLGAAGATTSTQNTATAAGDSSALALKLSLAETSAGNILPKGANESKGRSKGDQRHSSSKNDKKRRSKEDTAGQSYSSSSLATILEEDEKDDDDNAFATTLPCVKLSQSATGAASTVNPNTVSKSLTENTPNFCPAVPPNAKTEASSVPEQLGATNDESRMTVAKPPIHNCKPKEGPTSHSQHSPDNDGEDMDETEDDDFMDLTLSPPAVEFSDSGEKPARLTVNALTLRTGPAATVQALPSYRRSPLSEQPLHQLKKMHPKPGHSTPSKQKPPLPRRSSASPSASVSVVPTDINTDSRANPQPTAFGQHGVTKSRVQGQIASIAASPDKGPTESVAIQKMKNKATVDKALNKQSSSVVVPTGIGLSRQGDPIIAGAPSSGSNQSADTVDVVAGGRNTIASGVTHQQITFVATERTTTMLHGSSKPVNSTKCTTIMSQQPESADSLEDSNSVHTNAFRSSHYGNVSTNEETMFVALKQSPPTTKMPNCGIENPQSQDVVANSFQTIGSSIPQDCKCAATQRHSCTQLELSKCLLATAEEEMVCTFSDQRHDAPAKPVQQNDGVLATRRNPNGLMIASTENTTRDEPTQGRLHCPIDAGRSEPATQHAERNKKSANIGANKSSVASLDAVSVSNDQTSDTFCKSLASAMDPKSRHDADSLNAKSMAGADEVDSVDPCYACSKLHPSKTSNRESTQSAFSRLVPWTTELAGRSDRAHGINVEPIFKLHDGRWYRHPVLPPGWTIGVSRSSNTPYYMHPDFGSTFYCPVALPSAEGEIVGTSLIFHAGTPMKIPSFQRFAHPSGAHDRPVSEFPVSGNIEIESKSRAVANLLHVHSDCATPDCSSTASMNSKGDSRVHASGKLETDAIQNATPLGAFAVATNSIYSSSQNENNRENSDISNELSFINDDDQHNGQGGLGGVCEIPAVVVVVTKSALRNTKTREDTEEKVVPGEAAEMLPFKNSDQAIGDDNRTAATSLNLSDESDDSAQSSPTSLVWFGSEIEGMLDDSKESNAACNMQMWATPSFELAPMHEASDHIRLRQHNSPTCSTPAHSGTLSVREECAISPFHQFEVGTQGLRHHCSSFQLSTKSPSPTDKIPRCYSGGAVASTTSNIEAYGDFSAVPVEESNFVFPVSVNATSSATSDVDFPEANSSEQSAAKATDKLDAQVDSVSHNEESNGQYTVEGDTGFSTPSEGSFSIANNSPLSPAETHFYDGGDDLSLSLPMQVIFGCENADDDISRLDNTPVRATGSGSQNCTSFQSKSHLLTDSRCKTMASVFECVFDSAHGASKNSQDASTIMSRSIASTSFSVLSRVSRRTLYPSMPICALQNVGALPFANPKRKSKAKSKSKKRKKYGSVFDD